MLGLLLVGAGLWYLLHLMTPRDTVVSEASRTISIFTVLGACIVWVFSLLGYLWKGFRA